MRFPGLIGPSYTLSSVNVDCQRSVNLYPEIDETGRGKEGEIAALVPTPGLRLLVTLGVSANRCLYTASNGRVFSANGNKLYELDSDFNSTELGTLNSSEGQISMADDGYFLVAVDGVDGYQVEFATNTFSEIIDDHFFGADQVAVIDGYFIFNRPDGSGFYLSTSVTERLGIDPTAMAPTFDGDEAPIDGDPDNNNGMVAINGNLWMLNLRTTEVYYDSADTFPFSRIQGSFIEYGCAARFSVSKLDNSVIWLGQSAEGAGMVFQAKSYQPQRISTHAIEKAISGYTDIQDAVAYSYQDGGHHFYVLNFPSADTTWVYDSSTQQWHERTYTNQGTQERHRAICHTYGFNTHIVGDRDDGRIYEMTTSVFTDDGDEIIRERVAPHISSSGKRVFYSLLQVDMETGTGLDGTGQGTDPQVMLTWSNDGGHTWSNERWASAGKIGEFRKRAKWEKLGSAYDRVFKIRTSDPVKIVLIGANIEFTVGSR